MSCCSCNNNVSGAGSKGCCCDPCSACALKCIIDKLDDLNDHDLCVLDELIDRLLCCHRKS